MLSPLNIYPLVMTVTESWLERGMPLYRYALTNNGVVVDAFVLSFEHGVQKPDPAIFRLALEALGVAPDEAVMVGDRPSHDGGAAFAGVAALVLPPAPDHGPRGLDLVLRERGRP